MGPTNHIHQVWCQLKPNLWIELSQIKIFELNFPGKKIIEYFLNWIFLKNYIEYSFELNFMLKLMNNSYFESIFAIVDEKIPFFFVYFGHFVGNFWALFLFDQY